MLKKIGQTARYSEFKPLSDKLKKLEESINGQQGLLEGFVNKRKEFLGNLCEEVANYCSCVTKNITTSIESLDYMIKHYSVSSAPSHPLQASLLRTVIDKEKGWEPSLPRSHTTAQLKSVGNLTNEWSQQRTEYVNTETTGENQNPIPVYSRRSEYNINTSKKVPPIFTLGKFRETERRDPSVHNGQPNINMACSTPPESSRLPNHYQESGVYTTASHKSIREELVRQLKGNFALEIDSLTESLQMTITVYSQKVAILEKRLHGIEEFIKSQTFISLTMRKRESATSLLEPIISKLQTNIATLSSQNKALQLNVKVLESEKAMTDSQLQGQISIVEYLQKALAEARSVPAVILPPISSTSSEVGVEKNRLAQEVSGLRSKLSQQEQQIESLQQIESKLAKENSEMAHKIESLKRMNTSLQEVITQYKRSQEVRVEVNREQLLQKEQLAHQNSILKSQKSFLVEENNFKAKEQEYKEKFVALETKIKNLEKENLLLVGEIDRKQDVINSVKGESIKHKQSAQKLTKERNHLKDQLKVKEKELIDALTSTEDKKEDHRTSVHTKGDATNGNMCQNHEQTIKELRETVQNLTREYETVKQQAQDLAKLNGLVSEDQTQLQKKMQTLKESCILFESELIKANVKIEENVVEIAELKAKITSLVHEGSKLVNTVQESSDSKIVKQEAEQFKEFLKAYPRQE